jgi:dihydrolipoamide dehydrogenase
MESFDVIFLGGGPGGYVGAIKAAQLGLKVALIDKEELLGGTCLNVGCIPSKALLHATEKGRKDLQPLMQEKEEILKKLGGGINFLFKKNKVTFFKGKGEFLSKETISINGETIQGKHIVIATGSEPLALPFLPLDEERIVSSTGALSLSFVPKKMLIVGGGVIGLELGSVYRRLGSEIEVIEFMDRILPEFDLEISKAFQKILEKEGFIFHLGAKVVSGKREGDKVSLEVAIGSDNKTFSGDVALISIGRKPFTEGLGLEKIGLTKDNRGFIPIDGNFRTAISNIFAIGDVAGQPMLAHKASEEGIAVAEILAGHKTVVDYASIPNVVYTFPEIASVGFTEKELQEKNIPYKKAISPFAANSRYQASGYKEQAFIKGLSDPATGLLLGVHILAPHASELISQPVTAIRHKLSLQELTNTCFPHPTLSEALHELYLALLSKPIHF